MKFELIAQMIDGAREELSQPEFVGDGLETLAEAIEAAKDALEYINADGIRARYIDVYCDESDRPYGYCGFVDDCGWHRDCDLELG